LNFAPSGWRALSLQYGVGPWSTLSQGSFAINWISCL
jgi:hypothetical protein